MATFLTANVVRQDAAGPTRRGLLSRVPALAAVGAAAAVPALATRCAAPEVPAQSGAARVPLPLLTDPLAALRTSAATSAGLDAELLTLCELFHRQHAAAVTAGDDRALNGAVEERESTSHQIQGMRPVTALGQRMKASVAVVLLDEMYDWRPDAPPDHDIDFAWATLRDIAGQDSPDAELIHVCGEYEQLQGRYVALCDGPDAIKDDEECALAVEPIRDAKTRLLPEIRSLRATTLEGFLARARLVLGENLLDQDIDPIRDAESSYHNVCLMAVLFRDLAASAGVELRPKGRLAAEQYVEGVAA